MTLKYLEKEIKRLDAGRHYYNLNTPNGVSINILKYNKKKSLWEYYFQNERGGISDYRTFESEEFACEYAYQDAVTSINIFEKAFAQAEKEKEEREKNHPD